LLISAQVFSFRDAVRRAFYPLGRLAVKKQKYLSAAWK
jgi:hypothetical protein